MTFLRRCEHTGSRKFRFFNDCELSLEVRVRGLMVLMAGAVVRGGRGVLKGAKERSRANNLPGIENCKI